MPSESLADLKNAFFNGGSAAELAALQAFYDAGMKFSDVLAAASATHNGTYAPITGLRQKKMPRDPLTFTAAATPRQTVGLGADGFVYANAIDGSNRVRRSNNGYSTESLGLKFSDLADTGTIVYFNQHAEGFCAILAAADGTAGTIWFAPAATAWGATTGWTMVQAIGPTIGLSISQPVPTAGGTVLLAGEYQLYTAVGANASTQLWLSRNGGQTWTSIRTKTRTDNTVNHNNHWHGSCYDPAGGLLGNGRIWASGGDFGNNIWCYSDNWGTTWVDVPAGTGAGPDETLPVSAYNHPTLVCNCTNRIVVGPDGEAGNAGFWEVDKATGLATVAHELVPVPAFFQFPRGPYAQNPANKDEVYWLFSPGSVDQTGTIYLGGSGDGGESFHQLWSVPAVFNQDFYTSGVVGPDSAGRLYIPYKQTIGGVSTWQLLVGTAPAWMPQVTTKASRKKSASSLGTRQVAALVPVVNTIAETSLFSLPIFQELQAGTTLRIVAYGTLLNNSAGSINFVFRLKIGATTVLTTNSNALAQSATARMWRLEAEVSMLDPKASQIGYARLSVGPPLSGNWNVSASQSAALGTFASALDFTTQTPLNAVLTVAMGTADAAANVTPIEARTEKMTAPSWTSA